MSCLARCDPEGWPEATRCPNPLLMYSSHVCLAAEQPSSLCSKPNILFIIHVTNGSLSLFLFCLFTDETDTITRKMEILTPKHPMFKQVALIVLENDLQVHYLLIYISLALIVLANNSLVGH